MTGRRALVVINRKSRHGRSDLTQVLAELRGAGLVLTERDCPRGNGLSALIAAESAGQDMIIVGGGDGTLNAALEGVVATGLPLGVLPLGTANDFARTIGLPANPLAAAQVAASGRQCAIDLGWVNGKHFLNVASVGLSVHVTAELSGDLKRRWGRLGYALSVLRAWRQVRPFIAHIRCDQRRWAMESIQVAVGNGRHFGGGMIVAADARIDDARLDLFALAPLGVAGGAALLPRLRQGRLGALGDVRSCQGREVDLDTAWPLPVNTDGEITTRTPARFMVRPRAIRVMAPPEGA